MVMSSPARKASNGKFVTSSKDGQWTVRDSKSGQVLPLKGYGSMKGRFEVSKGIDLTKPIAEQARAAKSTKGISGGSAKRR
jgi:hypothetical protein